MATYDLEFKTNEERIVKSLKNVDGNIDKIRKSTSTVNQLWTTFAGNLLSAVATNAASFIKNKLVGAFSSLVGVLKESIRAAQVQEDAINKLNSQLVISGTYTRRVSKEMQFFASRLQEVTKFGDEAILGQLAFAVAMGATNKQAQQVVTAAADMAEALNIDLNAAVRNIAKTLGGYAGELGEVIPELKNLTAEQLRAGEGVKLLADRFKGAAADAVDTYSGRVQQLDNAYGDLTEQIGVFVTNSPIVREAIRLGKILFEDLSKVLVDNKVVFQDLVRNGILIAAKALQLATDFTLALIVAYKKLNLLFGTSAIVRDIKELEIKQRFDEKSIENLKVRIRLTKDFDEIRDSVKEIKVIEKRLELIQTELKSKRELLVTDSERFKNERTALVEISIQLNKFVKQLDKTTTQELDDSKKKIKAKEAEEKSKLNAYKKRIAKEKEEDKKKQAADKKLAAQNLDATKSSLDIISTLTSSANSELFAIGKAGAVASATINGYEAVTKAFAIGGPLGFILGPLVALAVANQIHGILATPKPSFATGGVVPFTPGAVAGQDSVDASLTPGEVVFNEVQNATLQGGFNEMKQTAAEVRMLRMAFENGIVIKNLNGQVFGDIYTKYLANGGIDPTTVGRRR